jgi:hypothetical protein
MSSPRPHPAQPRREPARCGPSDLPRPGGELRQRDREGQEDQRGALRLVVNAVVHWNTRYLDAALSQVRASGLTVKPEDVERLSPLLIDQINALGRYEFALKESIRQGPLRPLRDPGELDDLVA